MADITLRQLLRHWQGMCADYTEGTTDIRELELTLDELGSSIGYYAEIVPQTVLVPAPADYA